MGFAAQKKSNNGTGFPPSTSVFPSVLFHQCSMLYYLSLPLY